MGTGLFTALDELAMVIGAELAADFIAHRKMLKKPMTPKAGQLMADRLRKLPDAVASVEQSIRNGWQDCFEVREDRQRGVGGIVTAREDLQRRIIEDDQRRNQRLLGEGKPDPGYAGTLFAGPDTRH